MNSISPTISAADLALALFDEAVVPLATARRAAGRAYFPLAGDPAAQSYFGPPTLAAMGPDDFGFPGDGDTDRLIDALAAHWTREGEAGLAALVPRLKAIAATLRAEQAEAGGEVDILCYTMF